MDPNRPFGARNLVDNLNIRRFPQFRGVGRRLVEDDVPPNPAALPDPAQNGVLARHAPAQVPIARRGRWPAGNNVVPRRRPPQRRGRRVSVSDVLPNHANPDPAQNGVLARHAVPQLVRRPPTQMARRRPAAGNIIGSLAQSTVNSSQRSRLIVNAPDVNAAEVSEPNV